jgi:hypothetical protein
MLPLVIGLAAAVAAGSPVVSVSPAQIDENAVVGGSPSPTRTVTVSNTGTARLTVRSVAFTGGAATSFALVSPPTLPLKLAPGASADLAVQFTASTLGPQSAKLHVRSDDPVTPDAVVAVQGLGTKGLFGAKEPSLQWILDTERIPVNDGDSDPTTPDMPGTPLLGDEIALPSFVKAGAGQVTLRVLAAFSIASKTGTMASFGWYPTGDPTGRTAVLSVANADDQSLDPPTTGSLSFDPGTTAFGLWSLWPAFGNRKAYSDDALNTWDSAFPHKVRVYPDRTPTGARVKHAYVVATEEFTGPYDYNDLVVVVGNVKPAS